MVFFRIAAAGKYVTVNIIVEVHIRGDKIVYQTKPNLNLQQPVRWSVRF